MKTARLVGRDTASNEASQALRVGLEGQETGREGGAVRVGEACREP